MPLALLLCLIAGQTEHYERGVKALEAFEFDQALGELEQAVEEGPYTLEQHIQLHEGLAIVYASLGKRAKAKQAYDQLLSLAPGHVLNYGHPPKVTLLFEEARDALPASPVLQLGVRWTGQPTVDDRLPVEVDVVANAGGLMERASIFVRRQGTESFEEIAFQLPEVGQSVGAELPAVAAGAQQDTVMELYLAAYDKRGNEVLRWNSGAAPRALTLRYEAPSFLTYWWLWAIGGGVVVAASAGLVWYLLYQPPDEINAFAEVP